jgi:Transglutaminase-like superfamily
MFSKFLRLHTRDWRLLACATVFLIGAKIALRVTSVADARHALARFSALGRRKAIPASPERITGAVVTAGRILPGLQNCLLQALAAEAILARAGYDCHLQIGAAKDGPHKLVAHAWLERDGKILLGDFEPGRFRKLTTSEL